MRTATYSANVVRTAVRHSSSLSLAGGCPRVAVKARSIADEAKAIEDWWAGDRFANIKRPYNAVDVRLRV